MKTITTTTNCMGCNKAMEDEGIERIQLGVALNACCASCAPAVQAGYDCGKTQTTWMLGPDIDLGKRAVGLLRKLETNEHFAFAACPVCLRKRWMAEGIALRHTPECELAAVITAKEVKV